MWQRISGRHGEPVFQIYDLHNLIEGLGGVRETREALEWFRSETTKAGFPGLHLQLTVYGDTLNYSGVDGENDNSSGTIGKKLGFSSMRIRLRW